MAIEDNLDRLIDAVWDAADQLQSYHRDDELKIGTSTIKDADIRDVSVVAIGDQSCTLTFEADIRAEHAVEWMEEDEKAGTGYVTVVDTLSERSEVSGTAKVRLSLENGNISEVTILELDNKDVRLTVSPIGRW